VVGFSWWLLIGAAFGFVVGHWVAVPAGAGAWAGWLYYDDSQHPERPRLEGNLDSQLPILLIGLMVAAIAAGVVVRWALRRWAASAR
jgi:hypothetical protein